MIPHQFDSCPDKLILKAYQVKYNPKKMKRSVPAGMLAERGSPREGSSLVSPPHPLRRLEKEYAAMKSKEMEEQIEIKVRPREVRPGRMPREASSRCGAGGR